VGVARVEGMMSYDRKYERCADSDELLTAILGNESWCLVAAIPWGSEIYLVFERETPPRKRKTPV
jgi:hypothetical protein